MDTTEAPTKERILVNKVPQLMNDRKMSDREMKAHVILSGSSTDTADRLVNGDTRFSIATLAKLANQIGCEISEIIDLETDPF